MNKYFTVVEDIKKHHAKWRKEFFHFIYSNRNCAYQVDLYYYPDTKQFSEFPNPGGNSWLNDNHVVVYSVDNEDSDEWMPGNIRETARYYKEEYIYYLLDDLVRKMEEYGSYEDSITAEDASIKAYEEDMRERLVQEDA